MGVLAEIIGITAAIGRRMTCDLCPFAIGSSQKMQLIALTLQLCILWPAADAVSARAASSESSVHPSACTMFIDIIRESLRSELEVACVSAASSRCEDKNIVVRSILIYIDTQRLRSKDDCDTALEALERLRELPSQDH
ncbi:hypothetical protein OR16_03987 [Cupriavidus basilensis OR16]|uniref:Uncharacterized protein n=2 Tax=Cupriavidus basilensis TaxID=68895 RepID=H1RZP8_9BURK|nr:hypothetical protein OR16_03987 [Cupriavidus basilensis OR16]